MCGSGVAIGMPVIYQHHRLILLDLLQAHTACLVEVAGAAMRWAAVCRFVPTLLQAAAPTTLASV